MTTERYEPPIDQMAAMRAPLQMLVRQRLKMWLARWGIWLPIAYLIGFMATDLHFIFWICAVISGISLAFTLLTWRFVHKQFGKAEEMIETEAVVIHEYEVDKLEQK